MNSKLFRIALGLALLLKSLVLLWDYQFLLTESGVLPISLLLSECQNNLGFSLFLLCRWSGWSLFLLSCLLVASVAIIIDFRVQASSVAVVLLLWSAMNRNPYIADLGDYWLVGLSLCLMVLIRSPKIGRYGLLGFSLVLPLQAVRLTLGVSEGLEFPFQTSGWIGSSEFQVLWPLWTAVTLGGAVCLLIDTRWKYPRWVAIACITISGLGSLGGGKLLLLTLLPLIAFVPVGETTQDTSDFQEVSFLRPVLWIWGIGLIGSFGPSLQNQLLDYGRTQSPNYSVMMQEDADGSWGSRSLTQGLGFLRRRYLAELPSPGAEGPRGRWQRYLSVWSWEQGLDLKASGTTLVVSGAEQVDSGYYHCYPPPESFWDHLPKLTRH